ncbi:hypothetical protein GCM10010206_18890 [Streptomyces cinerochromogenes]|nr:hypothetical protein GCM10010206_18890 [Streptomyces cinerochromogenes]
MRFEGVAAGQYQTVRAARRDDVREEPVMGFGDVHGRIFPASRPACAPPDRAGREISRGGGNVLAGGGH